MKAQISVEFIMIFAIILLVFTTIGYVFLDNYEKATATKGLAQSYADDLKARFISVSLSPVDVTVNLTIPKYFNGIRVYTYIYPNPDNLLIVKRTDTNAQIASVFLPIIVNNPIGLEFIDADNPLIITKKDDIITVSNS